MLNLHDALGTLSVSVPLVLWYSWREHLLIWVRFFPCYMCFFSTFKNYAITCLWLLTDHNLTITLSMPCAWSYNDQIILSYNHIYILLLNILYTLIYSVDWVDTVAVLSNFSWFTATRFLDEASDATTWHVATADVGSLTGEMGFLPVDQAYYCWSFKEGRIPTKTTENATTPMVNSPKTQSPRNSCGWRLRLYGCYTVYMSFDIVSFPFSRHLLNYLREVFWQC